MFLCCFLSGSSSFSPSPFTQPDSIMLYSKSPPSPLHSKCGRVWPSRRNWHINRKLRALGEGIPYSLWSWSFLFLAEKPSPPMREHVHMRAHTHTHTVEGQEWTVVTIVSYAKSPRNSCWLEKWLHWTISSQCQFVSLPNVQDYREQCNWTPRYLEETKSQAIPNRLALLGKMWMQITPNYISVTICRMHNGTRPSWKCVWGLWGEARSWWCHGLFPPAQQSRWVNTVM